MDRATIVFYANRVATAARWRGPILRENATVDQLVAWLQWNDPNGDYDGASGEFEPLTLDEAWDLVADMVKEEAEADGHEGGGSGGMVSESTVNKGGYGVVLHTHPGPTSIVGYYYEDWDRQGPRREIYRYTIDRQQYRTVVARIARGPGSMKDKDARAFQAFKPHENPMSTLKIKWHTTAPGTSALRDDTNGYTANGPFGEFHINAPTYHHRSYSLQWANTTGMPAKHGGLWHDLGSFNSPNAAKSAAQQHAERVLSGVAENPLSGAAEASLYALGAVGALGLLGWAIGAWKPKPVAAASVILAPGAMSVTAPAGGFAIGLPQGAVWGTGANAVASLLGDAASASSASLVGTSTPISVPPLQSGATETLTVPWTTANGTPQTTDLTITA